MFFFPFLFPNYCHSVVYRVVSIIFDGCNQSSFVLFYEFLECQRCHQFWQVLFLPPFLIHTVSQRRLWDVMHYAWSLVFLFFGPLQKRSRISNEEQNEFPVRFHFFANSLMSSIDIRWLIFSCDILSLYPAVHFLSMWLSGIMAIMNSNGDSTSPWNTPL